MKKLWGILLTAFLIFTLAGCSIPRIGKKETPPVTVPDINSDPQGAQTLKAPGSPGEEQIEKTVLYDQGGVTITATGLDVLTYGATYPKLYLTVENNTASAITIRPLLCSINGYMAYASLSDTAVDAHSSADMILELSFYTALEETGTEYIVDMELNFEVIDPGNNEILQTTGPLRLATSAAINQFYTYDDSGAVVVDDSSLKIVLGELIDDGDTGQYQEVYVYNNYHYPITIMTSDVTVNGQAIDPYFYTDCATGKHDMDRIYFFESELEAAGIDDITGLELTLTAYDYYTMDIIYDSGPLAVTYED